MDHYRKYKSRNIKIFKILIFSFVYFLLDTMPSEGMGGWGWGVNCDQVIVHSYIVQMCIIETMT